MQDPDKAGAGSIAPAIGGAAALAGTAVAVSKGSALLSNSTSTGLSPGAATGAAASTGAAGSGLTEQEASRFLMQATNGATRPDIALVQAMSVPVWLFQQYYLPRGQTHWQFLKSNGSSAAAPNGLGSRRWWDYSIWRQLITAPDQLRQRVALALLDIMVVGVDGLPNRYPQFAMAAYMDLLLDNAFGNFRQLLGAITTSSAMGQFLTFLGSSKASPNGVMPDENYARELMQLFTIGLYDLSMDGTRRLDSSGEPIPTFDQNDVSQLARVFTGLSLNGSDANSPDPHGKPLIMNPAQNETGPSYFLGSSVSGGGMAAVNAALDIIFYHHNVPPFFARGLIQRLVTSNPSPSYVRRVANCFADNGQGVRGDMKAVISAIFTDSEARGTYALTAPQGGRLRDPVQRITGWARAFKATSKGGLWPFGDMSGVLLQSPGRSPSVFNFFRPGYSPPNSGLQQLGLVSPELQITDEQSTLAWLSWMYFTVNRARGDIMANYASLYALAPNAAALFDEVNLLLAAGQLSAPTRTLVINTLNTLDPRRSANLWTRVWTTVMLVMSSPEYMVAR